jgi:prepilin signal peptidase PulO-like enzyme (type II secretory pathway)
MSSDVPVPTPPAEPAGLGEPNELQVVDLPQPPAVPKVRGWHRPLIASTLLLAVCYVVIWPIIAHLVSAANLGASRVKQEPTPLAQTIELQALKALSILWIVSLGGTVGSFLNVVAYRMPRGKSVIFSPSSCPKCKSKIRPTDNIPVLGWLRLEGKCRSCHNPISPRYPIVEAIVAALFLLLFASELTSGGANLPLRTPNGYWGIVWILFELRWDLIQLYLYHCGLFSLLVSWVLVDIDRQRVTWLAIFVGISVMVIPLLIWPHLLPVPAVWPTESYSPRLPLTIHASLVGGAIGVVLGLMLSFAFKIRSMPLPTLAAEAASSVHAVSTAEPPVSTLVDNNAENKAADNSADNSADNAADNAADNSADKAADNAVVLDADNPATVNQMSSLREVEENRGVVSQLNFVSAATFVGFALGWQAVMTIALLALAFRMCSLVVMNKMHFRLPFTAFLLVGAMVHHLSWRWISRLVGPLIADSSLNLVGLAGLGLLLLMLIVVNRLSLNPTRFQTA